MSLNARRQEMAAIGAAMDAAAASSSSSSSSPPSSSSSRVQHNANDFEPYPKEKTTRGREEAKLRDKLQQLGGLLVDMREAIQEDTAAATAVPAPKPNSKVTTSSKCQQCGKSGSKVMCVVCNAGSKYCSDTCQANDWKRHQRVECVQLQ